MERDQWQCRCDRRDSGASSIRGSCEAIPSIPREVSQNLVARSASAVVPPRHPDRRMLPQRGSKTDGLQPGHHSSALWVADSSQSMKSNRPQDDSVIEGLRQDERDFCRREAWWWQPSFPTTGLASPVHAPRWATIGGTIVLLSPHDELFKHQLPTPSMDHFPCLSSIVSPAAPARATSVGKFCRSRFFFCGSSWLFIRHTQLTAAQPIQRELIP